MGKSWSFWKVQKDNFIRHGGFDEVMCLLGTKLEYKIPVKEVFLEEVERRFQNLYNSIDKLTEIVANESKTKTNSEEQKEENPIQKAIELEPGNAENHMMRAFIMTRLGNNQEVEKELHMAVKLDSSNFQHIKTAETPNYRYFRY